MTLGKSPANIPELIEGFRQYDNFAWTKINHGFWEALSDLEATLGWPVPPSQYRKADKLVHRPHLFRGGFVDELLALLETQRGRSDPALHLNFGLTAWPGDNEISGMPRRPERSRPFLARYADIARVDGDGLLLKRAIHTGEMSLLFEELRNHPIVLVGPDNIGGLLDFAKLPDSTHIPIHYYQARKKRFKTEKRIAKAIERYDGKAVVLLQAATLAPYWILRLRPHYPEARWIDGGLAFSIANPEDLLERPWGKVYRHEIVRFYNAHTQGEHLPEKARLGIMSEFQSEAEANTTARPVPAAFLARAYGEYLGISRKHAILVCANQDAATEALVCHQEARVGKPLRWVASALTFPGRDYGFLGAATIVDCNEQGNLSLDALASVPPEQYDGIVITNVFGLLRDYSAYVKFARRHRKVLILDNARGLGAPMPKLPYQSLSLHEDHPFGAGKGGLIRVPRKEQEKLRARLVHDPDEDDCVRQLEHLDRAPEWVPLYRMQAGRMKSIAVRAGLQPLFTIFKPPVTSSLPFLSMRELTDGDIANDVLKLSRDCQVLEPLPNACRLTAHLVSVPCHPDVAQVPGERILELLRSLSGP